MKVLLALDFSEMTDRLITEAMILIKAMSAEVWLLHVVEPEPDFVGLDVGPQTVRDALAQKYHAEHKELQEYANQIRANGLEATALLIQQPFVAGIIEQAEKLDVNLIMLGSHGHGAVYNLMVGSVCQGVLEKAHIPVCIIPAKP